MASDLSSKLTILNPAPYARINDAVMAEATWLVLNESEFDQLCGDVADVGGQGATSWSGPVMSRAPYAKTWW